jgi:mycothiol synthase
MTWIPATALPAGYTVRRPVLDDVTAVFRLVQAAEISLVGECVDTLGDYVAHFQRPRHDLRRDAWLVIAPLGQVAGYAWIWNQRPAEQLLADLCIHPGHRDRGIAPYLLACIEDRARDYLTSVPAGGRLALGLWCHASDATKPALLERAGYTKVRDSNWMTQELGGDRPEPAWPAGITVRAFRRERDEPAVYAAMTEAFAEGLPQRDLTLEEWRQAWFSHPDLDLDLWFVAWAGDEVAGSLIAFANPGEGFIDELAVRRDWCGRGLGQALLLHAFRTLAQRGERRVALMVDAANSTGAVRLYERVGMRAVRSHVYYETSLSRG